MAEQERRLKAILRALGVRQYYGIGCEADDVIGRLAYEYSQDKDAVVIYSGDSDLRQLVNDRVCVIAPGFRGKDAYYGREEVLQKHGVPPELLADQKALSGDSSDNIPGIPGIGPVKANKLIDAFGGIESIIAVAHGVVAAREIDDDYASAWPIEERFVDKIVERDGSIRLYKKLTLIEPTHGMGEIKPKKDKATVVNHFKGYRFRSLLSALELMSLMKMNREA
jgi:5'-3' exonuclease